MKKILLLIGVLLALISFTPSVWGMGSGLDPGKSEQMVVVDPMGVATHINEFRVLCSTETISPLTADGVPYKTMTGDNKQLLVEKRLQRGDDKIPYEDDKGLVLADKGSRRGDDKIPYSTYLKEFKNPSQGTGIGLAIIC